MVLSNRKRYQRDLIARKLTYVNESLRKDNDLTK